VETDLGSIKKRRWIALTGAAVAVVAFAVAGTVWWRSAPSVPERPALIGYMGNFDLAAAAHAAPAMSWHDGEGGVVSLKDFRGKVVLLNIWATWCAPCIRELPSLNALQARLGGTDFTVVALNIDRGGVPAARRLADRLKLDRLAIYVDPKNTVPRAVSLKIVPTTMLYDSRGRELGRLEGTSEWNAPEAVALIKYFVAHPDYADSL
jgi:thiol-disulfide isomerase/thioredoxin